MFEESDEFCPHCDNHFVIDAETKETKAIREGKAQMVIGLEMEAGRKNKICLISYYYYYCCILYICIALALKTFPHIYKLIRYSVLPTPTPHQVLE